MSNTTGQRDIVRTLTATVLFVDVVGSTVLRASLGEERADAFVRDLEARITDVVAQHQGRVVKGLGDGAMAVFEAAVDAVGAAVALHQQVELAGRVESALAVQLRIGISAGDVSIDGTDVLGAPVVEASRLCAAAQPSQVLVADLVRSLSRGRGSFVFESVGELPLKGIPEPVPACRVMWDPVAADSSGEATPFPGLLATGGGITYVGRPALTGSLMAMLDKVLSGEACLAAALLSGEPGIGKTRTAAELARRAHAEGAIVLYGCCDEELGVPFQPFVEALDFYSTHHAAPRLGRLPGELVRLCPEVATRAPGLPEPVASDPRTEEYRLFEAVTSWLIEASAESGIVLVVDDIHWATRATLLLLVHLLKAAAADRAARLLVVGTYRDTELGRNHPLTDVLADLRRVPGVERLDLHGLDLDETIQLVQSVAGHELDAGGRQLAEAAFAETEGNPLFMGEVLRHFVETATVQLVDGRWQVSDPGQIEVPEGVRDVLGRRLGRLSETANRMLSVAAVIGRDFDLELLAQVSDIDDNALLDALDEASRARIIEETGPDRFRFFHAMVKETLYGELTSARRRRAHQTVLEVLEKLRPYDAVALAYHAVEAGPSGGDLSAAVGHLLGAAVQSAASSDLASAETYYRQAIELVDAGDPDPERRIEAAIGLGTAQRDQSNPAFRETLLEATHSALALGRNDLAAQAAVANFRGVTSVINDVDRERVDALERTISAHEGQRCAEVALLLATLVAEIGYDVDVPVERRLTLTDRAIDIAREIGDPRVLAEVLIRSARSNLLPNRMAVAQALVPESVALADASGDPTLAALSRLFEQVMCLGIGEIERAEHTLSEALRIAETDCPPMVFALCRVNTVQYLLYADRLQEATDLNNQILAFTQQIGIADGDQWWGAVVMAIEFLKGAFGDVADAVGDFAARFPNAKTWQGTHAWTLAEAGRLDEAREVVARHRLDRPDLFPVDDFILAGWTYPALLALMVEDASLGAAAEAVLRPHEHLWITIDVFCIGPVSWPLATALGAQRRFDEADEMFQRAESLLAERGLHPGRRVVTLYRAISLSRSNDPEHRRRTAELIAQGLEESAAAGLDPLRKRFGSLALRLGEVPPV
ncbi:MAG TPA: AAA family ATPase [Mycobacteriales bacterium]|nr:AAA family ATPase [Mycobacteriales bacterium]